MYSFKSQNKTKRQNVLNLQKNILSKYYIVKYKIGNILKYTHV